MVKRPESHGLVRAEPRHDGSAIIAPYLSYLPFNLEASLLPIRLLLAIPVIHTLSHFRVLVLCFLPCLSRVGSIYLQRSSNISKHINCQPRKSTIATMSSSIAIPKRKQPSTDSSGFASSSSSSPYPSWANNAPFSPSSLASTSASPSSASTPSSMARYAERRPSLLGMSGTSLIKSAVAK